SATSRQKAEAGHGAVDPAEGLKTPAGVIAVTDHDRAVSVHAKGSALVISRQKAEADHAARCRPAEGFIKGANGPGAFEVLTDNDPPVGVHAVGNAPGRNSWQKAEADHARRCRPAEGLVGAGIKAMTDHDPAVSVHANGHANVTSRQKAEADHPAHCLPAEGLKSRG